MEKKLIYAICLVLALTMIMGCADVSPQTKDEPQEVSDSVSDEEEEEIAEEPIDEEPAEEEPAEEPIEEEAAVEMSEDEMEAAAKDIVNDIDGYKWLIFQRGIFYDIKEVGDSFDIELNDKEKATISTGSASVKRITQIDIEPEWVIGQPLEPEDAKKAGIKIFGEPANIDLLDNYSDQVEGPVWMDGDLVYLNYIGETDTDIQTNETYVNFFPGQIRIDECCFVGHWSLVHEISNFCISYLFDQNPNAETGISLSEIHIERINKDTPYEYVESSNEYAVDESFYGIWIGAFKGEDDAEKLADQAIDKGFENARVLLSTDWDNLSSEPYYVVSAGMYDTKEDASAELDSVKSAGFNGAYVKYTGEYIN